VKHEDFRQDLRDAAIGEAFEMIEGRILPSLTFLIESAAAGAPGIADRAEEIRTLAAELEVLAALIGTSQPRSPRTDLK
jgi:hypothetical protein